MRSLWAYIEGMVDLSLPFTATNSSDLAAGSDLALCDPLQSAFTPPVHFGASQFFYAVASMFSLPMRSLWACIEGVVDLSLPFAATNSSDLAAGSDLAL